MAQVVIKGKGKTESFELREGLGFQALCARHAIAISTIEALTSGGTRVVDERGPIAGAGRPGKLLREFDA